MQKKKQHTKKIHLSTAKKWDHEDDHQDVLNGEWGESGRCAADHTWNTPGGRNTDSVGPLTNLRQTEKVGKTAGSNPDAALV